MLPHRGIRYTHWHVTDKLNAPLFTIFGNSISPRILANMFLLLAIANAVIALFHRESPPPERH